MPVASSGRDPGKGNLKRFVIFKSQVEVMFQFTAVIKDKKSSSSSKIFSLSYKCLITSFNDPCTKVDYIKWFIDMGFFVVFSDVDPDIDQCGDE